MSELNSELEEKEKKLKELQDQLEEAQRRFADLEGKLKDQNVRERIRDVEKAQSIAELKQIISNLEFQVDNQSNGVLTWLWNFYSQLLFSSSEKPCLKKKARLALLGYFSILIQGTLRYQIKHCK